MSPRSNIAQNLQKKKMRQIKETVDASPDVDMLLQAIESWKADWNLFAHQALNCNLDPEQQSILTSVQYCRRTTVRSGHARGKDYIAAVASICFLFLKSPCKVINTAPTGRQVTSIMMAEISGLWKGAMIPLGGELLTSKIRFDDPNWFLEGFKAADKDVESWTGYHSPHLMVVVTESSGLEDETFNAIEGLLTGDSRLLLVGNPNRNSGQFYQSFRDPAFSKYTLDCLDAPNVRAHKNLIPGQVDWDWVNDHVLKPGWTIAIAKEEYCEDEGDFEWEGRFYRPTDLFRSRVRGMQPKVDSDRLIPIQWVEAAQARWRLWKESGAYRTGSLRLGVDVAGMGADLSCFAPRWENVVTSLDITNDTDHMSLAGKVKNYLALHGGRAYVDSIGEGAGVHSRLREEGAGSVSVKFSEGARNREGVPYKDKTGQRTFVNMRAYCYWALRDALDPQLGGKLCLPPDEELSQELAEMGYIVRGNGEYLLEPKDDIKARLGRSPDRADAIALTFYPRGRSGMVAEAAKYEWRDGP